MTDNYLSILAETIRNNWDQPALTDFYLTEDGTAQDTSRGNHYTYGEMYAEICRVAELLSSLGLQKGDHIAICGANSSHWVIAYLAIAKMQGVSVTVMHSLMPEEIVHLVNFSDAKALFVDVDLWAELAPSHRPYMGDLSSVISLSDWSLLDGCSDRAMSERRPREDRDISFPSPDPDDLAMICFTSGTSGNAKGVMVSQKTLSFLITSKKHVLSYYKQYGVNYVSFMPYAHIYGVTEEILRILCGGLHSHIICTNNLLRNLLVCYRIVQPMYIMTIPKILEVLIQNTQKRPLNEQKAYYLQALGGKAKEVIMSGALLKEEEIQYLLNLDIPFSTAYGMTEAPITAFSLSHEYRLGTAGIITKGLQVRISPSGEILVKGENVMLGYYKDPEATARKIDSDGWLHTGDKGHLDEDGYLYVEGRLEQDIIVLPNGENIRPDNIESLINALPEVSESIVLARDGRLVAIAVLSSPSLQGRDRVRLSILRTVNPQLPLFSQLYDVEITDQPLARTEKQTIKRYLYS